ncbi:MAG: hypothetical protein ABL907_06925 [Hyphomicrobium sp.]
MSERRKIVIENYPADRLPEDLRRRVDDGASRVTVTIESSDRRELPPLTSYIGQGKGCYASPEEAVAAINALRDEWE